MMKKAVSFGLSCILLTASLAGCGSSQPSSQPNTATTQAPSEEAASSSAGESQQPSESSQEASEAGQEAAAGGMTAGTYEGTGKGNNGPIVLEVVVTEEAIQSVTVVEHGETPGISDAALERIPAQIVEYQSLNLDAVSGATNSSNGILDGVADAIVKAGGDAEAFRTKEVELAQGEDEEMTADILVIGAGTSGTPAALAAARTGARVVVIESASTPGGAGAMTGGTTYAPGSSLDTATDAESAQRIEKDLDFLMDYTHYNADRVLLREYMDNTGRTIDMLMEDGMMFAPRDETYLVKYANRGTEQFVELYKTMEEKYGVTLLTETHGETLLVSDDGSIAGATAKKADGGTLTVHAQKVILATGGFGGNNELLEALVPNYVDDATNEGMYADGSGHEMAWAIGAKKSSAGIQVHNNSLPQIALDAGVSTRSGNDVDNVYSLANTPLLWVNSDGQRFANEDVMYSATLSGNVIYKEGVVFVVCDQETVAKAAAEGLELRAWRGDATVPLTDLEKQLEEGIQIGYIFKGNTLEELAESAGMTVSTLEETVSRYNEMVENKEDTDYGKAPEYLKYSIEEGPFYAIQLAPRYLGTFGGLAINKNYQVLDTERRIIDGLYATGFNAEGWMGSTYVDFSGITMSFALTSGVLAGEHAAANLQ